MKRYLPALPLLLLLLVPALLPEKFWLGAALAALMLTFFLFSQGQTLASPAKHSNPQPKLAELDDPFEAEVLFGERVVARLSDRVVTEMFWRSYQIKAVDEAGQKVISDDGLWDRCAFDFRDPKTGTVCTSAFVGGSRPFVCHDRVSIRALYFSGGLEDEGQV